MKKTSLLLALFTLIFTSSMNAQSPVGTWKTIDDETGQAKSHVEIFESGGKLFGKITQLLLSSPDKKCDKCPGDKKGQPIVGMNIIENMEPKKGMWRGGKILDPEKGKTYTCEFWLADGNPDELRLRGYIAFFYRTQTWFRVK